LPASEATATASSNLVPFRLVKGYVNNYTLVVADGIAAPFFLGDRSVTIKDLRIRAEIEPPLGGNAPRVTRGVMSGRIPLAEYLPLLGSVQAGDAGILCKPQNRAQYESVAKVACGLADLVDNPQLDGQGAECNSFSFVFRFGSDPIRPIANPTIFDRTDNTGCAAGALIDETFCSK
jgi:hypothetical protein